MGERQSERETEMYAHNVCVFVARSFVEVGNVHKYSCEREREKECERGKLACKKPSEQAREREREVRKRGTKNKTTINIYARLSFFHSLKHIFPLFTFTFHLCVTFENRVLPAAPLSSTRVHWKSHPSHDKQSQ
jgi:hypothetical protein